MSDESLKILLAVMYALAAILPLLGLSRQLLRTSVALAAAQKLAKERGHTALTYGDLEGGSNSDITAAPKAARTAVFWDIGLVGIGLGLGAVASIWSLNV